MKELRAIIFVIITLAACQSPNNSGSIATKDSGTDNHDKHTEEMQGLTLNNGTKWKADSTTILNVDLLQKITTGAKKASLENYQQTAVSLEDGLKKMVSECKMKGADHDALHHWLEPLMARTKELKSANDIGKAAAILGDIKKQINLFPQYFQG